MNLEEIKAWLESNKEQDDVKAYLGELSAVSPEKVKGYLQTDEGRRLIQPELDRYHAKSLESWKQNNLESLVEDELKKRNPEKSPAELEVEKLRKEIEDERRARNREALKNKALEIAGEKKLPKGVLEFFVADDEETTTANLSKFEEEFSAAVQSAVDARFKEHGRNPLGGAGGDKDKSGDFGKKLATAGQDTKQVEGEKHYFGE